MDEEYTYSVYFDVGTWYLPLNISNATSETAYLMIKVWFIDVYQFCEGCAWVMASNVSLDYGYLETTTTTTITSSTTTTLLSGNYSLIVVPAKTSYNLNDSFSEGDIKAYFKFRGVPITGIDGGACTFSVDDGVFTHSTAGDFGEMTYSYNGYFYSDGGDWVRVKDNLAPQTTSINVSCTSGAIGVFNSTSVNISSFQTGQQIVLEFVTQFPNGVVGDNKAATVRFKYANSTLISNATCRLFVNEQLGEYLNELTNHLYQVSYNYATVGTYNYEIVCTRDYVNEFSVSSSFTVTSPTVSTTIPTTYKECSTIGLITYDITSCIQGNTYFLADRNRCTSNYRISTESNYRVDCRDGYYCDPAAVGRELLSLNNVVDYCISKAPAQCGTPSNPCECSDERSMSCSARTGFTCNSFCNQTAGKCYETPCIGDSPCPTYILWANESCHWEGCPTVVRKTICFENYCRLSSCTTHTNATTEADIEPLSGLIYDDGTLLLHVMACQDGTNGFKITTPVITHKQYLIQASDYTPYIPTTSRWETFGTDGKITTATIPPLCNFDGELRYSRLSINSELVGGSSPSNNIVDSIIFRYAFNASISPGTGSDMVFTLNRNGTCFVRKNKYFPYLNVSTVINKSFSANFLSLTNSTSIEWMCNSTYGEKKTGKYDNAGWSILLEGASFFWNFLFGWIDWKPWYILIIFLVILIPVPLIVLLARRERE